VSEQETRNKVSSRRYFEEIWNEGKYALLNDLLAPTYVDRMSSWPAGPEGVRQEMSLYRKAIPNLHFRVEDVIAEDDKVVTRLTVTGTQHGDLPRIPAAGKQFTVSGIVIFRFDDGRAVEGWMEFNFLGLYRQLGAIPS
jgi:steroid delta-isomerase-like uncharacterized protein